MVFRMSLVSDCITKSACILLENLTFFSLTLLSQENMIQLPDFLADHNYSFWIRITYGVENPLISCKQRHSTNTPHAILVMLNI